jgi:hypothetical protein
VHALCNLHTALAPDGLLIDTQPLSPHPPVIAAGAALGALDMRAWLDTTRAIDERVSETLVTGLYDLQFEQRFTVVDSFDDGPDCLETARGWRDTRVPPSLGAHLEVTETSVTIEQEVRLRLLRRRSR